MAPTIKKYMCAGLSPDAYMAPCVEALLPPTLTSARPAILLVNLTLT